jgi:U4/U6 small nuclear ribonucleoprotein PRP3
VSQPTGDALIAQKRAEIAAKVAAMKSGIPGLPAKPSIVSTPPVKTSSPSPAPLPAMPNMDDLSRKVAEAKRRVAEAQSKLAVKDNPYMVRDRAVFFLH